MRLIDRLKPWRVDVQIADYHEGFGMWREEDAQWAADWLAQIYLSAVIVITHWRDR